MTIGLEYITKLFGGSYSDVARKLNITPQTVNDWIREKRKIPQSRIKDLALLFKLNEEYFQKELTEIEKIEININYLNRLSKRDTIQVPSIYTDENGINNEVMEHYDPHADELRMKYEELHLEKLIMNIRGILFNEAYLTDFRLTKHFDLLKRIIDLLERDTYKEDGRGGFIPSDVDAKVNTLLSTLWILSANKLEFGFYQTDQFEKDLIALMEKHGIILPGDVAISEGKDGFFD